MNWESHLQETDGQGIRYTWNTEQQEYVITQKKIAIVISVFGYCKHSSRPSCTLLGRSSDFCLEFCQRFVHFPYSIIETQEASFLGYEVRRAHRSSQRLWRWETTGSIWPVAYKMTRNINEFSRNVLCVCAWVYACANFCMTIELYLLIHLFIGKKVEVCLQLFLHILEKHGFQFLTRTLSIL